MDMQSQDIDKLAEALSKAQGAMEAAKHDHTMTGEKYTFRYASLASVHAAIRQPLSANGLAYTQVLDSWDATGKMVLITTLMHESGQFVRSVFPLNPQQNMQAFGSALTYAKRYSLSAIVGISSDEDDDGQAAGGTKNTQRTGNTYQRNSGTPPPATQHRQPAPPNGTTGTPANGDAHGNGHGDDGAPLLIGVGAQAEINKLGLATFGQKTWLGTKRAELVNAVSPEAKGKIERLTVEEGINLFDALRALADPAPATDKTLEEAKAKAAEGKALLEGEGA